MGHSMIVAVVALTLGIGLGVAQPATAAEEGLTVEGHAVVLGLALRAGGRFDNVRMCVATPAGVMGGPAADISVFAQMPVNDTLSVHVNLPVMRPILFAIGFQMLQFEPEVGLLFRKVGQKKVDFVAGPTLGVSLHYGPDYKSASSGAGRRPSFFAMGPQLGAYLGLDFKRPTEKFNFQLGLSPYIAPLFGVNDPGNHRGVVAGGMLDLLFRFAV